jgi:hypothetical protein
MIARAERLRHEEVLNAHRLNARGISTPRAPGNPYASLWTSVPLKAALSGSDVQLDLSSSPALKDRAVLAIRYGWALADGGDTCCPQENVNALGLALSRFMFAVLQEFLERNRLKFSGAMPLCDARRL